MLVHDAEFLAKDDIVGVGPQKRMVTLGVNALARETGLARQTISDRMKKGATASEIRVYAAMRERRPPQRKPTAIAVQRKAPKFRESGPKFDATLQAQDWLQAIDDARLRRMRALAEKLALENRQQLPGRRCRTRCGPRHCRRQLRLPALLAECRCDQIRQGHLMRLGVLSEML